ncbi:MAG: VWA domain-containing protein [Myxococcales bacterium]|nr:VWA domain-containing protein [Myxococcales bacterium]MCB9579882.1 VWA domain-containing protein [Polyangiaceae bacterium]
MSFVVWAALAIGVLVGAPIAAHLLRRSRADEREFPPAALVPAAQPVARQRRRLEDRLLLALRAAMIVALAVLGATPLVRCSRLSLTRQAGGSVALALVLDDSLSMRTRLPSGKTRWERALAGAHDLLNGTREGDAVAIVLAGAPARLALAATTDLEEAERALDDLAVSDRPTDLGAAVQLARSALEQLPHADHRVVVLSDFADDEIPDGKPPIWAPLPELRGPSHDCGIVEADRRGRRVTLRIACSSAHAAKGRSVTVLATKAASVDGGKAPKAGEELGSSKIEAKAGVQLVGVELGSAGVALDARLDGKDAIAEDDSAPVSAEGAALGIGVVADPSTATVLTGGATVLEQALSALGGDESVRPLTVLPDERAQLDPLAAVFIDDPGGIPAEARATLGDWVSRGGVAVALLGPRAESAQLGSTLEPFVRGAVHWEKTKAKGVESASVAWLGAPGESLSDLAPEGRALLEGIEPTGSKVVARWDDQKPFILETASGRGLILTVGLPVSVDQSDFALRPGFLALLEHAVEEATRRAGPRHSVAGATWLFPAKSTIQIRGPRGPVEVREHGADSNATVALAGRYEVSVDGDVQERVVNVSEQEITARSHDPAELAPTVASGTASTQVDASRQLALVLLGLFVGEIALRARGRRRPARERRKAAVSG